MTPYSFVRGKEGWWLTQIEEELWNLEGETSFHVKGGGKGGFTNRGPTYLSKKDRARKKNRCKRVEDILCN